MTHPTPNAPHQTILAVSGMTCGGCANTVTRVLSRVPGVVSAQVDHQAGLAVVQGDAPSSQLIAAVEAAGFGASDTSANVG